VPQRHGNLQDTLRSVLKSIQSVNMGGVRNNAINILAMEGSKAATIVVEVPSPSVFQVIFSLEVFPSSSIKPSFVNKLFCSINNTDSPQAFKSSFA
jgi:hypothetical protein